MLLAWWIAPNWERQSVCLDVRVLWPRTVRRRLTLDSAAYTDSIRQGLQEYAITPDHCAAFIADHAPPLRKALRDMKFGVLGCGCHGLQLQPRHVLPEVGRNGVFQGVRMTLVPTAAVLVPAAAAAVRIMMARWSSQRGTRSSGTSRINQPETTKWKEPASRLSWLIPSDRFIPGFAGMATTSTSITTWRRQQRRQTCPSSATSGKLAHAGAHR